MHAEVLDWSFGTSPESCVDPRMAIYPPQPLLTSIDKELLVLLAKVVLEQNRHSYDGNVGEDHLLISDEDAAELCDLLTEYANSHAFMRAATFTEMVSDGRLSDDSKAREIYLKTRSERGRKRVLSSRQWADFRARLGLAVPAYSTGVVPMDSIQFVEMEVRLLRALRVHPALEKLIEDLVIRRSDIFERIERREQILSPGQIRRSVMFIVEHLRGSLGGIHVPKNQIVGVATLVSDVTVMFSTRDWGVAGTLSTMAGALAMSVPETDM